MRDIMERFVFLPFTAGCISESSIPIVMHHTKRSKLGMNSTPTRTHEEEKEEEREYVDDEESLKGALPRFQKLFKNFKTFSQLFVYKELEQEMGLEIGFPTDVKHVTHIGLDGCATSIFSTSWSNLEEPELINLHSFPLKQLDLAIASDTETPNVKRLLETKHKFHDMAIAQ
ncbi:crib domain-containing protein ric4 [Phtheirospermum japonicum]|uniref:Crib domain-containing protein ric4 n=1 Tax=Phtheirospermum japonicum TaxID=374723 RepID=A0A830CW60_9LAMI|nr:crib domain-containing protein ric4 [Phtheirospermum japonicum]